MPQISFEPLPVLKEGEGIEESENLAISIVDGQNSWTIVQKKKKNKNKTVGDIKGLISTFFL